MQLQHLLMRKAVSKVEETNNNEIKKAVEEVNNEPYETKTWRTQRSRKFKLSDTITLSAREQEWSGSNQFLSNRFACLDKITENTVEGKELQCFSCVL